ncbi:MAG TPA: nitrate- and nitrite sensing domain-containing protein [Pilimelia sp.]|nr:nitrate- and nitrite sensing domain-containing protein [Pilimelia sp.]
MAVIVVIAVLGLSWFALTRVIDKLDAAGNASQAGTSAKLSVKAGNLLHAMQRERGRSSQFISSKGLQFRDDLARQRQDTDGRLADFEAFVRDYDGVLPAQTRASVDALRTALEGLANRRVQVDKLEGEPSAVIASYTSLNLQMLDLIAVSAATNAEPSIITRLQAYLEFLSAKEAMGQERAQLSNVFITGRYAPSQFVTVVSLISAQQDALVQFERIASPDVLRTWKQAQTAAAFDQVATHERRAVALPSGGSYNVDPTTWWDAATSKIDEMKKVEDYQADAIVALARSVENAATSAARIALGVVGLLLVATLVLAVAATRSIARPVQRLTRAATAVADLADRELARVSDVEGVEEHQVPHLAAIDVSSHDEVGELAAAFNRVQTTATRLVERQMIMRRNVGLMFANVAQRTQNLVNRQLIIVDQLESDEKNKHLLSRLYQLDHLSTRLRRSAKNLLVVSGTRDDPRMSKPTPLATALRSALAEIEAYQRVQLGSICEGTVAPQLVSDLVIVLAELLENATTCSPPQSVVDVSAEMYSDMCEISIVDHGMGMPPEQLAEENRRLVERERLDIAPTGMLGLFVVGRLARRHGLTVELLPTPGRGLTAKVTIPPALLHHPVPAAVALVAAGSAGHSRTIDLSSPLAMAIPRVVIVPTALPEGFPWFAAVNRNGDSTGPSDYTASGAASNVSSTPPAPPVEEPAPVVPRGVAYAVGTVTPTVPQQESRGGLVRRVPGAQLPAGIDVDVSVPRKAAPPAAAYPAGEAVAARTAMDGFQAAVTRFAPQPPTQSSPPAEPAPSAGQGTAGGIAAAFGRAVLPTDPTIPGGEALDMYATGPATAGRGAGPAVTGRGAGMASSLAATYDEPSRSPIEHDPTEGTQR